MWTPLSSLRNSNTLTPIVHATRYTHRSNSAGTKVKTTVFKRGGKGGVDRTGTQEVFKPSVVGGMGDDRNSGVSGKFGRVMSKVRSCEELSDELGMR